LLNTESRNLRVLIIAQYFYPDFGGSSTRAYNSAVALKLQGCDVTVVTAFPHYPHGQIPSKYRGKRITVETLDGLKLIRTWIPALPHSPIRNRILLNITFILSSFMAIGHTKRPDIIFAMNPNFFSFYSAIIYRLIFRRKIIRNIDDLWPEVFYDLEIVKSRVAKRFLDLGAKVSYKYSSSIIPVSAGYVKTLVEKYKVPRKKITVIEHGVDLNKFQKKAIIDSQNVNKKLVMYSGALAVGYDFESIVKAAKILQAEPVHFIIRGTGIMFDDILNMTKEHHLSNIEVSNMFLPIEDLVTLMNRADIFLLPMNSKGVIDEGLPTKILEYQALGKPIICISEGEPGRYITRCQSGLVVRPKQPCELAQAIMDLSKDVALCKKLGDNGYKHVVDNLTFEKIGKRLLEVIREST
jgi:glycosyltransferase involved in cell wall biosynthesis